MVPLQNVNIEKDEDTDTNADTQQVHQQALYLVENMVSAKMNDMKSNLEKKLSDLQTKHESLQQEVQKQESNIVNKVNNAHSLYNKKTIVDQMRQQNHIKF